MTLGTGGYWQKNKQNYFLETQEDAVVFEGTNLSKTFNSFILEGISVTLHLGEIIGVMGENGSGKSTLLKIIAGVLSQSSGSLRYPNFFKDKTDWRKLTQFVGYVPQQIEPWDRSQTLKERLQLTASIRGLTGEANEEATELVLSRLKLGKYACQPWSTLSGGYKLRFEIARQLIWGPKLLVLDEPLANLDIKAQTDLLTDLRSLANYISNPVSIILSSQNIYDIESIADRVIFLRAGRTVYNGPADSIGETMGGKAFLLNTNGTVEQLYQALKSIKDHIRNISEGISYKIIFTGHDISSETLFPLLITSNISIKYFRDISNSSRQFFEYE